MEKKRKHYEMEDRRDKKVKKDKKDKKKGSGDAGEAKKSKKSEVVTSTPSTAVASSSKGLVPGRKAPASTKDRLSPAEFREQGVVTIDNEDRAFDPIQDFSELDFDSSLLVGIKNFTKPTPIQAQCWPIILAKRDIIGIAETGSGKTMAFSLPILYHLHGKSHAKLPTVLILSPTRELATQTAEVCAQATSASGLRVRTCLFASFRSSYSWVAMMKTHFTTV